jgi:hypothetical protein
MTRNCLQSESASIKAAAERARRRPRRTRTFRDLLRGSTLLCLSLAAQGQPGIGMQPSSRSLDGYTLQWSTAATGFLPQHVIESHNLEPGGRDMPHVVVLAQPRDDGLPVPGSIVRINHLFGGRQSFLIDVGTSSRHSLRLLSRP